MLDPDFQVLFEASPEVLLVLLPDAPRFTMVAATAARFAATHTSRDTLGKGLFEVFPDNPDDPEATGMNNLRLSLNRVLATRQPDTMAVQKYDIRGPDGSFEKKYWSPKNIPVLSATGQVLYILHRVEDVTELVQASELGQELRDRTKEMEREVVRRSRELAAANQNLRDANTKLGELDAAKTAFFSNVSHEFRTPLTLLLGPLESALLAPATPLGLPELKGMHRNALRLLRLVNSLLDFSRLEAGRVDAHFAPTDLAQLTAGLAGSFQSLLDDAGLRLIVDCPPLPEPVYVDAAQWEKIVLNLISNAFKFTFSGEIEVRMRWHGDSVKLSVRDTGTGIPEHELPLIFERFRRVEGAKGRSFEGTGIGLSLVWELAQLHGGSVQVTSVIDLGSTFVVSIPTGRAHLPAERVLEQSQDADDQELLESHLLEARQWLRSSSAPPDTLPVEADPLPHEAGEAERRSKVLVVDDNADMRDYIAQLLSATWNVRVAVNGRAALEAAIAERPDLVLSDVMMPEMDGVQLLQALRAHDSTRTVPVILLSARAGEDARLVGLETGADDYLVKPFAARELLARVRTQLEVARVREMAATHARALAETRAQLVAKLEQANAELQASLDELAATQAQLIQAAKMASLGQLVAGIAHEINNPLAFLLSHLQTVERGLVELEPLVQQQADAVVVQHFNRSRARAREMAMGLVRIQELVQKLRVFSRLDEGELKLVSIRESVDAALTILGHRLEDRIEVETHFEGADMLECYASLLNQALINLLGNAIDAIVGSGRITISSVSDDVSLTLRVVDTGSGIPEAVRARVFEPFFTTKEPGQGTGLGLSVTYSIIKKHRGTIELLSAAGGGTEARIRVPLRASAVASSAV
ncbi:MAG TPA: ATP-binding protein [Polyangiaceae bacterium]|nr:ATP-binding protein [Polyangiaceae bacterium]